MADRWLAWLDEDPAECWLLHDGIEADAITAACLEWGVEREDVSIRPWTEKDERASRNAARRERYAWRRDHGDLPSRARPVSEAAMDWFAGLGMGASLMLHDEKGRCRCPACRRFATLDDFVGAPTSARIPNGCVDFGPWCRRCRS